ncbi:MAG: OmpA family protein [Tannerellaceae bacterium]|nr:OmpA family protein [Tannerellaceae bacterium]
MKQLLFISLVLFICSSCSAYKLKQADLKFSRKAYAAAGNLYREVYRETKPTKKIRKGYTSFQTGECYRHLRYNSRSMNGYKNALRYHYADTTLLLRLAQAHHFNGDYQEAIALYEKHLSVYPYDLLAQSGLAGCITANGIIAQPTRHHITMLKEVNSNRSDFNAVFTGRNTGEFYFLSSRKANKEEKVNPATGQPGIHLWKTHPTGSGKWSRPVLEEKIFPAGDTPDYITFRNGYFYYSSPLTRLTPEQSRERKIIGNNHYPEVEIEYPTLSPDGKYVYFCAELPDGYGGKDIYRAQLFPDEMGLWENLGAAINTPGDEVSPWLRTPDELYFSSDGHPGLGGLDIFKAIPDEQGNWEVSHLGYPLNSSCDDLYLVFESGKDNGLFCSNRDDPRGYLHLYSFEISTPHIRIEGYIKDWDGIPVTDAIVRISSNQGLQKKISVDTLGHYTFTVTENTSYVLMASAGGFLNQSIQFRTEQTGNDDSYLIDFVLTPTPVFSHPNYILYPSNSSDLMPESIKILEQLLCLLQEHPYTLLEISSHTDRTGSDDYNLILSAKRSESVINFFLAHGITEERIEFRNEGKQNPRQLTAEERKLYNFPEEECVLSPHYIESLPDDSLRTIADQLNRRTEFKIKLNKQFL